MSVSTEQNRSHIHAGGTVRDSSEVVTPRYISAERSENLSRSNSKKVNFSENDQIKKVSVGSISQKYSNSRNGTDRKSSFNFYSNNTASEENSTAASSRKNSPLDVDALKNNRDSQKMSLPNSPNRQSVFHASSSRSLDSTLLLKGTEKKEDNTLVSRSNNEKFRYHANSNQWKSKEENIEEKISKRSPNVSREIKKEEDKRNDRLSSQTRQRYDYGSHARQHNTITDSKDSWRRVPATDNERKNARNEQPKIKLTEESTSKPKKKPETFSLPPAKQNGSLVNSGDDKRDKNNNEASNKTGDKRQYSNPTKKSPAEETPRQSRSAPTKDRKSQSEITPKVNNYTKSREDTDISAKSKQNTNKDQRSKDEKSSNPSRASNHTSHSNKNSTTTEKYSVAHSQQSRNTNKESEKSVRSDKKQNETNDSKNENKKILDLEKGFKSPRSKTPTTARSTTPKTPRSKTPSYYLKPHKVRYGVRGKKTKSEPGKNDRGFRRTPEPKKSILNNKDAVKHERSPTSHSRPKSFKWERDKSIYRSNTRDWENERHEITHRPAVNSPTDWLRAYVGEIDLRDALQAKSRRSSREDLRDEKSKHKPGYPYRYAKEYILSRQQVQPYREMKMVYGDKLAKEKQYRQNIFFSRLQEFQIMKAKLKIEEMQEREKKKEETKKRQQRQLKELRQRFEDAAWVRFNSQYVTSRVLEHEKMNRYEYGLPEDINGEAEYASKLKRKPVKTKIDLGKLDKKNKEVYSSLFNIYKGPNLERNAKTPPMEGIDTVTFEYEDLHEGEEKLEESQQGNKVERTRLVKDVISDARKEMDHLKANNTKTGLTPRDTELEKMKVSDNKTYATNLSDDESDDDDDDMSDIFERARKKYNLEVDDDEDSKSRR